MTARELYSNSGKIPLLFLVVIIMWIESVSSSASLCLPGFQCVNGFCTSSISCQCNEGWTGVICSQPVIVAPSTTDSLFPIGTIEAKQEGEEGGDCETSLPAVLAGQPTPPGEDQGVEDNGREGNEGNCGPAFPCVHGVCMTHRGLHCLCDEGWEGVFCHETPSQTNHGNHVTHNSGDPFISGNIDAFKPEEGYGPLADISLRFCLPGFICRYGNCTQRTHCECEPHFIGIFCQDLCPLDCGPHGTCSTNVNTNNNNSAVSDSGNGENYECNCDPLYYGTNCSLRRTDNENAEIKLNPYVVVGICTLVAVVLVIALTAVPYILWRQGNIAMLKLVFWFQNIEDDDGHLYDAFVSYASTDEDRRFVMEYLIPVLEEQMAYTLCIHERDFMPGNYITSNIMDSVRQSRRTLMVVSPAFVSRNWCQFEFQMAVAEMIEKRHRILPVMMGDVDQIRQESNTNETLLRVLNTVTYLQYPGDGASEMELQRFWKRLELSMPKRINSSSPSTPCSPAPTPTSITPLSQVLPSHQSPYKTNGIIFPTSSQKINAIDETINAESPSDLSNQTTTSSHNGAHQISFSHNKKTGLIAWFRKKIGRRKKSSPQRAAVYLQNVKSTGTPAHVSYSNSSKSNIEESVDDDDKTISGKLTFKYDKDRERDVKPAQIELSGWTWPSPEPI